MKVSLALATYGRADELGRCLASLATQTHPEIEVLVLDQNPDDRLLAVIEPFCRNGLVIRHERLPKPGLSQARNLGIQLASGDVIGFPDDDCWYEPSTVANVARAFEADPDISGVVANWVEQTAGGANDSGGNDGLLSFRAWRNFRGGAASSISLFLKRGLLLELQGFDERLGVGQWYGAAEETDLVLRALSKGARLKREVGARVHHAFAAAGNPMATQSVSTAEARARGTGAVYAKHRLSPTTVLRGLAAPVLKPLVRMQLGQPLRVGCAIARGRLIGMRRWRRDQS